MPTTSTMIFGIALFACALVWMPDKYRPKWLARPSGGQLLLGLLAMTIATVIVMTPEFYALGILGDSMFFDLLVLFIGFQLQSVFARAGHIVLRGFAPVRRFVALRVFTSFQAGAAVCSAVILALVDLGSLTQKVMHRLLS